MAAFPCPYCGHALVSSDDGALDRCPSCAGALHIAYRYRLVEHHGAISGGVLYRAVDDGFDHSVGVVFVTDPADPAAVERFVDGWRLFADLGGTGLVKIHEVGSARDPRAYVVIDWFASGTLDKVVARRGSGLDQATLLTLVGDLLTGLSKAHRSMPAVVHGHVHPGKIGFRAADKPVLFGFEWATHVNAQASRLADTFTSAAPGEEPRSLAADLRQLGVTFHYAATGDWIGEQPLARQREQVGARVPGPLGRLFDRLLGAGADGYRSAVDAAIDFEQLMRGVDRWEAPSSSARCRSAKAAARCFARR